MYKISVPIINDIVDRCGRERLTEELRRLDADRVFLALSFYETDPEKKEQVLKQLRNNIRYFKDQGFEVGTWIWTFWIKGEHSYTTMQAVDGTNIAEFICPTDGDFRKFATDYIQDIAACGPDLIMFDDDFRYGFHCGFSPACLCDHHLAAIQDILGEPCDRETLRKHILEGGKNKYRDAWLQANGDAFRLFAREMREAVDRENPNIRMGTCACMTSWDIDGVDAYELATILAGKTRPFARLIGAPYWAVNKSYNCNLQDVIELERMEESWTRRGDIDLIAEGDAFPRPRINCPASYLEGFDTALRAAGCLDGIHKYGIDYNSIVDYETGYADLYQRNRPLYPEIERIFGNKTSCGIRIYKSMQTVAEAQDPGETGLQDLFFSYAARSLAACSVPSTYRGEGITGICFGENARNLPLSALKNGMILDVIAAKILTERGVDVGLEQCGDRINIPEEHFLHNDNYIAVRDIPSLTITLKSDAQVLSDGATDDLTIPLTYHYENAAGERFMVLNFIHGHYKDQPNNSSIFRHYERRKQYLREAEWLSGKPFPAAMLTDHPNLYMQCKKQDSAMAIGLWNFFADTAFAPTMQLDKEYKSIEAVNCTATLDGNRVTLSDIPPFGFAFFEVTD